ncbi:MAG: adenosine deaminase [Rhodothermia bacterium]|nr:adenosine deaminase [Rhodothermia bacterium]
MSADLSLSRKDILSWPKAELHCHLDGSLRLSTLLDLAREQGKLDLLPAHSEEELLLILKEIDHSETLESYLAWFRYSIPMLQTRDALTRVAFELAEDNAAENVRYLEVRFAPILCVEEGLTLDEVLEAVHEGLMAAERQYGIASRIIVCGLRDRLESASLMQAEVAVRSRDHGVVAFDLAGGEAGNPSKHHLHAFYYARNNLLNLTVHAGESWGPESIRQALFYCGAHRIGHGITLNQDPELMQYCVDHRIPLEICPTSNVQTHVVKSYVEHPIRQFVAAGVPVTVNTDNRLFSRTTVTDELLQVHEKCMIGAMELREIALNGFRYAFLEWDRKQELLRQALDDMPLDPTKESPVW